MIYLQMRRGTPGVSAAVPDGSIGESVVHSTSKTTVSFYSKQYCTVFWFSDKLYSWLFDLQTAPRLWQKMIDRPSFSILIVDDEEFVRHLLSSFLGTRHKCLTAASAVQALETLESNQVDLVMTDIMMPGISGLELCDIVRQFHPQTQIVIISALGDGGNRAAAKERGAFEFIEKPFDLNVLLSIVDRAMEAREAQVGQVSEVR